MNGTYLSTLLAALRSLKPPPAVGKVVLPRKHPCVVCTNHKDLGDMVIIKHTGVVSDVIDCVCKSCFKEHGKELSNLSRVVCATCKETVFLIDPHKEKSGFAWTPGFIGHVATCPCCSSEPIKSSPIAEKIAFYKAQGIPYL
jgi:hypothetical protein